MKLAILGFKDFATITAAKGSTERRIIDNPSRKLIEAIAQNRVSLENALGAQIFVPSAALEVSDQGLIDAENFINQVQPDAVIAFGQGELNIRYNKETGFYIIPGRDGFQLEPKFTNELVVQEQTRPIEIDGPPEVDITSKVTAIASNANHPLIYVNKDPLGAGTFYCNALGFKTVRKGEGIFIHMPNFCNEEDRNASWQNAQYSDSLSAQGYTVNDVVCMTTEVALQTFETVATSYLNFLNSKT